MRLNGNDLLLVIDVQRDFCPGGALPVPDGDAIIPLVNRLIDRFPHAVATQDWHPRGHASFASGHPGRAAFDTLELDYSLQTLWPDHCVQGTTGAALHRDLRDGPLELILRKGFHPQIDSYSAFLENDRVTPTGLAGYLHERGVERVFCVGLALDYCVRFSAEDARRCGFRAVVVTDACRAIDRNGSRAAALSGMTHAGVALVLSNEILDETLA